MDDSPEEAPPQTPSPLPFIIGIVVGLPLGGIFLTLALFGALAILASKAMVFAYLVPALIGAAVLILGIVNARRSLGFWMGLLTGVGGGLLGGTALCAFLTDALSNMR